MSGSQRLAEAFVAYMEHEGKRVTRAQFEQNLTAKLRNAQFTADIEPLLASAYTWDRDKVAEVVWQRLIAVLPGVPWKGRRERIVAAGRILTVKPR